MTYFIDPVTNISTFSFFSEFSFHYKGQIFIELLLLLAITVCGFLGNLLVIATTLLYKHMRTTPNIIMSLQATSDLILCCVIPMIMVVRITHVWTLGNEACKVWMFILSCSQGITTLCMSALSIDRYLCICRPEAYNFLKRHPYITVVIILLIGLSLNSPFILGWNTLTIEVNNTCYTFCGLRWPQDVDEKVYIFIMLVCDFLIPLASTSVVYSVILLQVRESAKRLVNISNSRSTGHAGAKLLKILVMSVCLYVLMFVPFVTAATILFYTTYINSSVFLYILALLLSDTVVNPTLLWVFNGKYRACMRVTMKCRWIQEAS